MGPRWGALGPELEVGAPGFPARRPPVSPPPAGRDGEELRAPPPRGGAGAGPERTGRGGPGTRGGAGPHTGRGGWLGPLRSRWRLEEEARRSERRGGGGGRGWSAVRRRLTSPAQQGKVWRARSPLLAPGARYSLRAVGRAGAAAAAGGRRARSGPGDAVGAGLPRPARSGGRAGCAAFPEARGERWSPRPLRPRRGRRWSGPGVGDFERGLRGPGERAGMEGRPDPAGCMLPGSPGRLAGALCGRRQSRAPTLRDDWGRPEGGRWGEKGRLWGDGRD